MSNYVEPTRPKPWGAILSPTGTTPPLPPPKPPVPPVTGILLAEWENLLGRLEDTYANHGHHPATAVTTETHVDPVGRVLWPAEYRARRAHMPHEAAVRSIESQIDTIEGRPDRWAPVVEPHPGGAVPRLTGLRTDGRYWASDAGYACPLGASALYALDGRDYRPYLAQLAGQVQIVRVLAGYLSPVAGRQETLPGQALERLPAFLAAARGHGLLVEVTALTDTAIRAYDWTNHVRAIAQLGPDLLELANEVQHQSQSPMLANVLPALAQAARDAGYRGPIAYGSNEKPGAQNARKDEIDPATGRYATAGGSYNTVHLSRGEDTWYHEACRLRELLYIMEVHGVPVSNDEPNRVEDTGDPVQFAFLMGCLSKGFGYLSLFHSQQARDCQSLSGAQLDAFRAYVQGWSLLPTIRYTFKNGRWADSPVGNASYVEGDGVLPGQNLWRTPSFLAGQASFTLAIGPDVPASHIEWQGGWHPAEPGSRLYSTPNIYLLRVTQ